MLLQQCMANLELLSFCSIHGEWWLLNWNKHVTLWHMMIASYQSIAANGYSKYVSRSQTILGEKYGTSADIPKLWVRNVEMERNKLNQFCVEKTMVENPKWLTFVSINMYTFRSFSKQFLRMWNLLQFAAIVTAAPAAGEETQKMAYEKRESTALFRPLALAHTNRTIKLPNEMYIWADWIRYTVDNIESLRVSKWLFAMDLRICSINKCQHNTWMAKHGSGCHLCM